MAAPSTSSQQCAALRKNGHVILKGRPCKIVDMKSPKSNNAGPANIHLIGLDILTGKKVEDSCPPDLKMDVPTVTRKEYQFLYTGNGFLHLMGPDGTEKNDVKVPDGELGEKIREYEEMGNEAVIDVISAMGEEAAISVKGTGK